MKISDPFHHPFKEREATQIACRIVAAYGGHINFYRLIKLLYIVEHESWRQFEYPAMGGNYFSLEGGPMISETANASKPDRVGDFPIWTEHLGMKKFEKGTGNEFVIIKPAGRDEISDAVLDLVDAVVSMTQYWDNKRLADHCDSFGEYQKPPQKKRLPIYADAILISEGKDQAKREKLQAESQLWKRVEAVLA